MAILSLDSTLCQYHRFLAADAVQKANSGHPGLPMGPASMAYALWDRAVLSTTREPGLADRDALFCRPGMAPCCSMRCCISPATLSYWKT